MSDDLRGRIAEAMLAHHIDPARTDADRNDFCVCGGWVSGPMEPGWDDHLADVAAGVAGSEIAKRDAKLKSLAHFNGMYFQDRADLEAQANDLETTLARIRELHASNDDSEDAFCDHCRQPYPCPTLRAIDTTTEEETDE